MIPARRVFVSVGFGMTAFLVAFSLGSILTMSTGVPLLGGLLNGVLTAMVLTVGMVGNRFWGNATIMWLMFSIPATATTTLGPPGIYKIVIALIAGLLWDLIYSGFRYRRWSLYLGGMIGSLSIMLTMVVALYWGFGEDAAASLTRYQALLWILLAVNLIVTVIGIYLGEAVYRSRLSSLKAFARLKSDAERQN